MIFPAIKMSFGANLWEFSWRDKKAPLSGASHAAAASQAAPQLKVELAVTLYAQEILSLGKARELAEMDKLEFGLLLGKGGIPRHYGQEELHDDETSGRGE